MRLQRGFSLIELLVVMSIILVLASLAIPNFFRSKVAANEASAVSAVRTINTAQTTYAISYPSVGYASNLAALADPPPGQPVDSTHAGLVDWVLGCTSQPCPKSGYYFQITNATGSPVSGYQIQAYPINSGQTGIRGFCGDQLTHMTFDPNGGTNCTQPLE